MSEISEYQEHVVAFIDLLGFRSAINSTAMVDLLGLLQFFAAQALQHGFLIRGGIAKRMFYHKDGIIFGNALVEAYLLESGLSNYPRVLVTQSIIDEFSQKYKEFFVLDYDGFLMLDYINGLGGIIRSTVREDSSDLIRHIEEKLDIYEKIILDKISANKNDFKILSKWQWFYNRYRVIHNAPALKIQTPLLRKLLPHV